MQIFLKSIGGKLAKSVCVDKDSTKIPKFRKQCVFLFQEKEVWSSKYVSLRKWTVVLEIKHYSSSDSLSK